MTTTTLYITTVDVVQISEEHAGKLNVTELKDDLKKRGRGTGGNKNILFDRLIVIRSEALLHAASQCGRGNMGQA